MDISSTLKTKPQGKTWSCNVTGHYSRILTTQLICLQYNLPIHLSNITMHFHTLHPTYHQWLSSTLQHITHIHPYHELSSDRTQQISNFSTSFTGIPNQAFLDHHCTCITRKFGMPLETFQQATHQNTNNSSDPWINTHQHQHNYSLHSSWNYLTYRTYTNPVRPL